MDKIKMFVLAFIAAVAAVTIWAATKPKPAPVGKVEPAVIAPALKNTPTETITPAKLVVYRPAAKKKLGLSPAVIAAPEKHVIASSEVASGDHAQVVTTVINSDTGESETVVQAQPLPWLAAESRYELRLDYGIKNGAERVARLSVRADLIQVKALHAGGNASVDSDGSFFAGVGVGYRF